MLGNADLHPQTYSLANASYPPITLTVNVANNAGTPLVNSATASGGGDPTPVTDDDPTIVRSINLAINKSHTGRLRPRPDRRHLHHRRQQYRTRRHHRHGHRHRHPAGRPDRHRDQRNRLELRARQH